VTCDHALSISGVGDSPPPIGWLKGMGNLTVLIIRIEFKY